MATLNATKIVVDTTGVYDRFIKQLIKNAGYTANAGEVAFVLHPDENQSLFIPRNKPSTGQVFLNVQPYDFVKKESSGKDDAFDSILGLLEERVKTSGYWIIWSDEYTCSLVPTPTTKKSSTKGFG